MNLRLLYAHGIFANFLLFLPFFVPYMKHEGFSMTEIFWLQSVFAITIVACEIPSGYLSDFLGRKKTLVSGSFLLALGGWILFFAEDFFMFALFEAVMGIGMSLNSGVDTALIYENSDKSKSKSHFTQLLFLGRVSSVLSLITGSVLAWFSFELALSVFAVVYMMPFMMSLFITENLTRAKPTARKPGHIIFSVASELKQLPPVVRFAIYNFWFWPPIYLLMVFTFQHIWQEAGIPTLYFGAMMAGGTLINAFAVKLANRKSSLKNDKNCVLSIGILYFFGLVCLLSESLLGILLSLALFSVAQGIGALTLNHIVHNKISDKFRVTIDSIVGTGIQLIVFALSPVLGFLIGHMSMEYVLMGLAAVTLLGTLTLSRRLIQLLQDGEPGQSNELKVEEEAEIPLAA